MSIIRGVGYGFLTSISFNFRKSVRNRTVPSFLLIINEGEVQRLSVLHRRTPSRTNRSSSFLNYSRLICGTGKAMLRIGVAPFFSSRSTGSVLNVPSVPSNSFLYFDSNVCSEFFSTEFRCILSVSYTHLRAHET